MAFKRATKEKAKLRLALMGPTGSGKTFTALAIAHELGTKVAVIDSERGTASKYSDLFPPFDTCDLESHSPEVYVQNIKEAERAGYEVLVIDSLSHAWMGKDGALEQVDKFAKKSASGNSFTAWREVTPMHNQLVDAMLQSKCHIIVTMRVKQEYILEEIERNGRTIRQPKKVGLAPVQRDGVEYEFDVIADMNLEHDLIVSKTRIHAIDGVVVRKPGKEFAQTLRNWLEGGAEPAPKPSDAATQTAPIQETTKNVDSGTQPTPSTGQSAEKKQESADTSTKTTSGKQSEPSAVPGGKDADQSQSKSANAQAAQPQDSPKVGAAEMEQLKKAGLANKWQLKEISDFVCHAFKLTPATITQITWAQWETAVKLVGRPENAGGKVVVTAKGEPLAEAQQWPKKGG